MSACMPGEWLIPLGIVLFVAFMWVVMVGSDGRRWDNGKWQSLDEYHRKELERKWM